MKAVPIPCPVSRTGDAAGCCIGFNRKYGRICRCYIHTPLDAGGIIDGCHAIGTILPQSVSISIDTQAVVSLAETGEFNGLVGALVPPGVPVIDGIGIGIDGDTPIRDVTLMLVVVWFVTLLGTLLKTAVGTEESFVHDMCAAFVSSCQLLA